MALRRLPVAGLALALACPSAGCSFSYQLDSMFGRTEEKTQQASQTRTAAKPGTDIAEGDLAIARAAASEVLARGGKDASMPWENPQTGARGTVTPIAAAYSNQDGFVCRDFLASYVRNGTESWMQGEACRLHQGRWEVRNLKPWQRT